MSAKVIEEINDIPIADREQIRLKYLRLSVDMGCCRGLRWKLTEWGDILSRSEDAAVFSEYEEIRTKAEVMYQVEDDHGTGSLLNLDHPIVQSLSKKRDPAGLQMRSRQQRDFEIKLLRSWISCRGGQMLYYFIKRLRKIA